MNANKAGFWLLSASALALAAQAHAADPTAPAAPQVDSAVQIQEVVVTATRRNANLQDVPIAVQAISAEQLAKSNFKNPIDLQYLSPSIQVSASGGIGFNIRGVGTNSFNAATEQTVGLQIDGVLYGFVDDIGGDISDAEQVEILKGPQGTQFGKNASGGLISVTTKRPSTSGYTVDAKATYGEHNDTNDSVRVNIPLSETLAGTLAASYQGRDGIAYNPVLKKKAGKQEQWGVKGKLLWTPTDLLSVYSIVDYRFSQWSPNFLSTYRAFGAGGGLGVAGYGIVPSDDNTLTGDAINSFRHTGTGGVSTQVDYKLGDFTLTSITAFRTSWRNAYVSLGSTPIVFMAGPSVQQGNQFTQELRLTSPSGEKLEYVAGLYYYRRGTHDKLMLAGKMGGLSEMIFGPGAYLSFTGGQAYTDYKVESIAAFVDGKYRLTDTLNLIGGARVSHDESTGSTHAVAVPNVYSFTGALPRPSSGSVDGDNYAYRVGLQYDIAHTVNAYGTLARGYKGPIALPVAGSNVREVKGEVVNSIELGLKTSFWDRRATANLSLFRQKFTDFQTSTLDNTIIPPGFVLGNAGGLKTQGVELETTVQPTSSLRLNAGVTYLDAHFTDFKTRCYSPLEPIRLPPTINPSGEGGCYTIPGTTTGYTQAAGAPLNNASKWNVTLQAAYQRDVGEAYVFDANANYIYRTKFFTNGADPNTQIDGYGVLGANVGIGSRDGKWRVGVFARNLLDEYYVSAVETGIFDDGALTNVINPEASRTIGIVLEAHY